MQSQNHIFEINCEGSTLGIPVQPSTPTHPRLNMMKNVLMACCAAGSATAFVVPATRHGARSVLAASSMTEEPKIGMVDMASITVSAPTKRGPVTSQAIPFLKCNPVLDGELAGDFGFDPLNFAQNKEALWDYREAEVKHARLAMLVRTGVGRGFLREAKLDSLLHSPGIYRLQLGGPSRSCSIEALLRTLECQPSWTMPIVCLPS